MCTHWMDWPVKPGMKTLEATLDVRGNVFGREAAGVNDNFLVQPKVALCL